MADEPPQPGLASRQDLSPVVRQIQRRIMLWMPGVRRLGQARREFFRKLRGAQHEIAFFHQVDDPYSHLAVQAIAPLIERYDISIRPHLVSATDPLYAPEPELLAAYARRDCGWIAPHYALDFPSGAEAPNPDSLRLAERMLAGLEDDQRFVETAVAVGGALWRGEAAGVEKLAAVVQPVSEEEADRRIEAGNRLRTRRRHYSGGMFWYAGEWYWGVDRLHHLERRLMALGAARRDGRALRFDRPPIDPGPVRDTGLLRLEIFPSLRSPYTAVIFERSVDLAARAGVDLAVHPVLPMVMRGVPAPAAKGIYIMTDALREAKHIGAPFGNMLDPIGRPVERGFSLWSFANEQGRGAAFLAAFLRAAFIEGRPTGTDDALRRLLEEVGLSFDEAGAHLDGESWRAELEANRQTMYGELGLWGVPAYRLSGPDGEPDLCVWGQDRLWLVAAEIRRRLAPVP
jgi:2-hydroxychromene-2-carboxylate isomerase